MDDNKSGGSQTEVSEGFGFGGTTNVQKGSEPQNAEGSHQDRGEQVETQPNQVEDLNEPQKEVEPAKEDKVFKKQAEDNRRMVIDMLEEKFQQVQKGSLSEDQLKQWFSQHPELGETANRSKRVKEKYRELMSKPSQEKAEVAEPGEDQPLTLKELKTYLHDFEEEREAKYLSKQLAKERDDHIENFAEKHQVLDSNFDSLKRNADALFKANPDWTYERAVQSAYYTINPQKGSSVNITTKTMAAPEAQSTKVDATTPGGVQLISASEFSGGQLN